MASSTDLLYLNNIVPTAEWLNSSAVGIAQLVVHAADESILYVRGSDVALSKLLWDFLLLLLLFCLV